MTSPVPLRAYDRHTLFEGYDSDTIAPSKSKGSAQSYGDDEYDPYDAPSTQGRSWNNTDYTESGMDKPSLSYSKKELGK